LPPTGSLPCFETVCHQMRGNPVAECYSKCCDEIGMPISTLRSLVVEKSATGTARSIVRNLFSKNELASLDRSALTEKQREAIWGLYCRKRYIKNIR
ncbi:unnamed protein product, partial [Didymodactylos carnosus]